MNTSDTTLGELFPGIEELPGVPDHATVGGPLLRHLERENKLSWPGVASLSRSQISDIPHVGPIRSKRLVENLAARVGARQPGAPAPGDETVTQQHRVLLDAIGEIATWAEGTGNGGTLLQAIAEAAASSAADAPRAALDELRGASTSELAVQERVVLYDPVASARALVDTFDDRETATLQRILDFDGSAPTLQEIGDRFGVTRERIRQVEAKVRRTIENALLEPSTQSLVAAASRLRERLGSAVPADHLVELFANYPPDLLDRLILHIAGPYRFDGNWYVLEELFPLEQALLGAFESASTNGSAPLDATIDALAELGMQRDHALALIRSTDRLRIVDDVVMDWRGSMADRAVAVLHHAGTPMTTDELAEALEAPVKRSMANQVTSDERFTRVGVGRYALTTWDMDTFEGVVPAMVARLEGGPRDIEELGAELTGEFGVSTASVAILSQTHPVFLAEGGTVGIRPADRPYEPATDLTTTANCFVVEGFWSLRVPVDREVLRGSGRTIPEAFSMHLGNGPLQRGTVDSPNGPIGLNWHHNPTIGTLRAAAGSLEAEEGDWLFVRRVTPSSVDFRLVRASDVPSDPAGTVRALVGSPGARGTLERVLADALGLRGTVNHDLAEELAVLRTRREGGLVDLVERLAHEDTGK